MYMLGFSEKRKLKKKEDSAPSVMTGIYMFPNGDKYGKCINSILNSVPVNQILFSVA